MRQRTMLVNALSGHLGEFGVIGAKGISRLPDLLALASSAPVCQLPDLARECIELLLAQIEDLQRRIVLAERSVARWHRTNEVSRRLETIPGVGVITASAVTALAPHAT
ncbi:MAG: transposase, partial [Alphaproteobacteria bacterium]|nr:transposase [Alphaproteobacteria bacterium]